MGGVGTFRRELRRCSLPTPGTRSAALLREVEVLTEFKEDMLDDRKVVLCRTAWSQALRPLVGEFYSQSHLTLPAAASERGCDGKLSVDEQRP